MRIETFLSWDCLLNIVWLDCLEKYPCFLTALINLSNQTIGDYLRSYRDFCNP